MSENLNLSIFKGYDIRGKYPKEINEKIVYKIGQSFVAYTNVKNVVIGYDMRLSSKTLFKSLVRGIISQGVDVYDIGQIPTEQIYFAVGFYKYDSGIMITASHNPKEYNGLKMIKKKDNTIHIIHGKNLIKYFKKKYPALKKRGVGEVKKINIKQTFLNHIFSFIDVKKIKPFKVVIDASNGMAGKIIPQIALKLPIKIIPLNFKLDGNFPSHSPNPLLPESIKQIKKQIIKTKADFGFIFDGDADRIFLINEKGDFIRADITLQLLIKYFLKKYPQAGIGYNLICSKAVPEFIKKLRGKPIRTKVGYINVQKELLKNNGIIGGELSGHYLLKDNYYCDSAFIVFLILLQIISESEEKVSKLVSKLTSYYISPEIIFYEVKNTKTIFKKIKEFFSDAKQDYLDGITIEYEDWWFNIRQSQTEPILKLVVETKTKELMEQKKQEISSLINKFL